MIVQPDFLDHWKTQLLIETLEDPTAPLYVIRLWAHCQNRKTHRFPRVNPAITKAICKASKHAPDVFENAMVECGFIRIEDGDVVAHDWEHVNASLIAAWDNGKKGGRPKKKTHGLTLSEPTANPDETDKRREEKIRVEEKEKSITYSILAKPIQILLSHPAEAVETTDILINHVHSLNPSAKNLSPSKLEKTFNAWATDFDKAHRLDFRGWEEMKELLQWATKDQFWSTNILCASKFRKQYDTLRVKQRSHQVTTTDTTELFNAIK